MTDPWARSSIPQSGTHTDYSPSLSQPAFFFFFFFLLFLFRFYDYMQNPLGYDRPSQAALAGGSMARLHMYCMYIVTHVRKKEITLSAKKKRLKFARATARTESSSLNRSSWLLR